MSRLWRMMALAGLGLLLLSAGAAAQTPPQTPEGMGWVYGPPPRFQIYQAPRPYGGLIMLDSKTGDTYQRVIVNTQAGIAIRWLKLPRVDAIPQGETVIWD